MDIEQTFTYFLDKQECLERFLLNLENIVGITTIGDCILTFEKKYFKSKTHGYGSLISTAFDWGSSNEDSNYWFDKACKWSKFYRDNRGTISAPDKKFKSIW